MGFLCIVVYKEELKKIRKNVTNKNAS